MPEIGDRTAAIVIRRLPHLRGQEYPFTVFIDEQRVGEMRFGAEEWFSVAPGTHRVWIEADGFRSEVLEFPVKARRSVELECGTDDSHGRADHRSFLTDLMGGGGPGSAMGRWLLWLLPKPRATLSWQHQLKAMYLRYA